VTSLTVAETYESGRHRYEGSVELDRTGPFGYTVRVLPRNPLLSSGAELGLVALPQLPDPDLSATLR
jgi:glycogen phosphorylase